MAVCLELPRQKAARMSEQLLREIRDELRGLRSDVRATTTELRKLRMQDEGCPDCGGQLEDTSSMAGPRRSCSLCGKSFAMEVVSG